MARDAGGLERASSPVGGDAGVVDDAPPAALDHAGERRSRREDDRVEIDAGGRAPVLRCALQKRALHTVGGVVHEHIDPAERVLRRSDHRVDLPLVGNVAERGDGLRAERAAVGSGLLQPFGALAGGQHEPRALLRKRQRRCAPDVPPGAGNERHLAFEPRVHRNASSRFGAIVPRRPTRVARHMPALSAFGISPEMRDRKCRAQSPPSILESRAPCGERRAWFQ